MYFYNLYRPFQKVKISIYGFCACIIILAAASFRLMLITLGWPVMNGDEAMMTVMAQHISIGAEHPIFFYGQSYMGTLEAYLGALLFKIFGVSIWSMRLGSVLFYTGFLICMYLLTSRVFTKAFALVILLFLSLGSLYVYAFQISTLGYTELPFLCSFLFLLAYLLATAQPDQSYWLKALGFLLWGIVAGALLWEQLITVPYILVSGVLLLLCCWRPLLRGSVLIVVLGLIIGAWPLISYNLHAAPGTDLLHTFLNASSLGSDKHYQPYDYISATLFIILPATLGLFPRCYIQSVPFKASAQPQVHLCLALQQTYGLGYLLLFMASFLLATVLLFHTWNTRVRLQNGPHKEKPALTPYYAHLLLLLGAGLTLLVFARNTTSVYSGVIGVRYLVCIAVSLPAIMWPLWCIGSTKRSPKLVQRTLLVFRIGMLIAILAVSSKATISMWHTVPDAQKENAQREQLITQLEHMHITRFYSEYWTCNALIAASHEQLVCGDTWAVNGTIMHGYDRYHPYKRMVALNANPGFVYPRGQSQIDILNKLLKDSGIGYQHVTLGIYEIYQPARPIPILKVNLMNPTS